VKPSLITANGGSLSLPQLELTGAGSKTDSKTGPIAKTDSIAERGEAVRASMHAYFDNTWAITEVYIVYYTVCIYKHTFRTTVYKLWHCVH
jgi:hypothetical protein